MLILGFKSVAHLLARLVGPVAHMTSVIYGAVSSLQPQIVRRLYDKVTWVTYFLMRAQSEGNGHRGRGGIGMVRVLGIGYYTIQLTSLWGMVCSL